MDYIILSITNMISHLQIIIPSNNSRELTSICDNVSTNVYTINSCIKNLQSVVGLIGTARDNQGLRDQIHVWQISANQVVKATPKDIARLTVLARTANKQQKLQVEKVTNYFKEAVQAYGQIQQVTADKLRCNLLKTPDLMNTSSQDTDLLLQDEQIQTQRNLEFEQELLIEREHRIKQIESDILDVNQLMRELGALVHEQGSIVGEFACLLLCVS